MGTRLDTLVIGQGLSGSLLAYQLHLRGQAVRVVEPGPPRGASWAAAGIVSPFTGPRYQEPDHLVALLEACEGLYATLERELGLSVFHRRPVWRAIQDEAEYERVARRHAAYPSILPSTPLPASQGPSGITAPLGVVPMEGGGLVDVDRLLAALRQWLVSRECLIECQLEYQDLQCPGRGPVYWQGYSAEAVVFCEGAGAFTNPWWQHLPWRHSRGETMTVTTNNAEQLPDAIVTAGQSLAPLGGGHYRLGATYDRGTRAGEPTEAARTELLGAAQRLLTHPPEFRVLDQRAGLRPGSYPGPPFTGPHPLDERIAIVNGFGSRGTLLAPWHTRCVADWLVQGRDLPPEADARQYRLPA